MLVSVFNEISLSTSSPGGEEVPPIDEPSKPNRPPTLSNGYVDPS
jgi:hypothetical protein